MAAINSLHSSRLPLETYSIDTSTASSVYRRRQTVSSIDGKQHTYRITLGGKITHPPETNFRPGFLQNQGGHAQHNEKGGFGNISSKRLHRRIAGRIQDALLVVAKPSFENRSRVGVILISCVLNRSVVDHASAQRSATTSISQHGLGIPCCSK